MMMPQMQAQSMQMMPPYPGPAGQMNAHYGRPQAFTAAMPMMGNAPHVHPQWGGYMG